jgi:Xaa-Pro aminopeptidase
MKPFVVILAVVAGAAGPLASQSAPTEVVAGPPFERPPPPILDARRQALLDSVGAGMVLVPSATLKSIEGDYPQDSDFRQHNDFFYLTGLETPDSWLLLTADGQGARTASLFVPERNPAEERWTGPRPSYEEATAISGISSVILPDELMSTLQGARSLGLEGGSIYLPLNDRTRGNELIQRLVREFSVRARNLDPVLAQIRLVKDDHELQMLRRAIDITAGAHRAALEAARPGMYEYELEAVIEYNFRAGGAERVGFPSIVGSGPNTVVLHYDKNRRQMDEGDLVVMDIGAEYSYYSADVTRTIPVSGRFTPRQREIYELVLEAQRAAIEEVRPGVTVGELNQIARAWLRENSGGACGVRTCDMYFVHGLSHWLGMDVHDVGDYTTPLAPGMVLTIEPGIYLPEENLGVRIEDDVLVTDSGYELLSRNAPRDPEQIEALMNESARR